MRKLFFLLATVLFIGCSNEAKQKPEGYVNFDFPGEEKSTNYYFIRHAEKETENPEDNDPPLTLEGNKRSLYWASHFKSYDLNAFYTTPFMRNFQTAIPTLHEYQGKPNTFYPDKDSLFTKEFWHETVGKNVLVVGHNNTTPAFVNEIIRKAKYPTIDEAVFGNLYHVYIDEKGKVSDTLYSFEQFRLPEEYQRIFEEEMLIE